MPDIVLTTLNAKFIHPAFGLRYLLANLGPLQARAGLAEFDIAQRPVDIVEALLARHPKIIGFGVYIWNVAPTTEIVALLKRLRPDIAVVLGGPEVSYETEAQPVARLADHVITGEADLTFAEVCRVLLEDAAVRSDALTGRQHGRDALPCLPAGTPCVRADRQLGPTSFVESTETARRALPKIIPAELPDFSRLVLPYDLYSDEDIAHRIVYVEASRGCPFTCEFCLSSLDVPVRQAPLAQLLAQLQRLLDRGVRQFKFVDRTFNLNLNVSAAILEFFLQRHRPGQFLHFEMVPDRLPEALRQLIARFPPGALQFEVGIQTFNETVGALIQRRQNYRRLEENLRFLRRQTGVHIHADLIAGLPGETPESFAAGFDRLVALGPHEIQVGLLKRLRGTPIVRHDAAWQMVYNPQPPYEILQNKLIDFATMQKLRRFARYWDLVGNSGNFIETTPLLWSAQPSPFFAFLRWSEWLYARAGRTDGIALLRLTELLFEYLTVELRLDAAPAAAALWRDYRRGGRRDKPGFLKDVLPSGDPPFPAREIGSLLPKRQARRLA